MGTLLGLVLHKCLKTNGDDWAYAVNWWSIFAKLSRKTTNLRLDVHPIKDSDCAYNGSLSQQSFIKQLSLHFYHLWLL